MKKTKKDELTRRETSIARAALKLGYEWGKTGAVPKLLYDKSVPQVCAEAVIIDERRRK